MSKINSFEMCAKEFNNLFSKFEDKVTFLSKCNQDKNWFTNDNKYDVVTEGINFFTANAMVETTRKQQQMVLMPIIAKIMNASENDIIEYFKNNENEFALFCLMYITFLTEENINTHIEKHHKFIWDALNKTVNLLINKK